MEWVSAPLAATVVVAVLVWHNLTAWPRWKVRLSRSAEKRWTDGPSAYAYGVLLVLLLFPAAAAAAGWLGLALGDALSNVVGRRSPIWRYGSRRTLGGSLGMVAGVAGAGLIIGVVSPAATAPVWAILWIIAPVAALVEGLCTRIDDNLVLPPTIAALAWSLAPR